MEEYELQYRLRIRERFGKKRLCDLTHEDITRWVRDLERADQQRRKQTKKRSQGSTSAALSVLSSILTLAVKFGRIPENLARGIELQSLTPRDVDEDDLRDARKVLGRAQIHRLYAACRKQTNAVLAVRDEALIRCGIELMLRKGEARGLRFIDLEREESRVHVQRQYDRKQRMKVLKCKEDRMLPVSRELMKLFDKMLQQAIEEGRDETALIFAGRIEGKPISATRPNVILADALRRAGLVEASRTEKTKTNPLIHFHGLRHTGASLAILDGIPLLKVSRFLGHARQSVTETIYSHLLDVDELDDIANLFDEFNADKSSNRPSRVRNRVQAGMQRSRVAKPTTDDRRAAVKVAAG